ncbi:vWA domain-containing protein [Allorhodopirellula solitaria]|uniref:von Willebrand factor n=1 Tax=Allorhodopirellula solitaria TaxID=2527987 RepID=A0A5C5YEM8_9BACT|nr:von Willebrand factor type A domain-containing protein [Allorhodopirellula solitaria]TWT74207.1 von Willebrand factor [Allorhodopirellula solitaria]
MNEPSLKPSSDKDLETRITAVVLGEASDFERDQIERLIEQRPDLVAMKTRFESVHRLLHGIGQEQWPGDGDSEWKLPDRKREALLAKLSAKSGQVATDESVSDSGSQDANSSMGMLSNLHAAVPVSRFTKIASLVCAACLLVAFGLWKFAVPPQMAMVVSTQQAARERTSDFRSGYDIAIAEQLSAPERSRPMGPEGEGISSGIAMGSGGMSGSGGMGGMGGGMGISSSARDHDEMVWGVPGLPKARTATRFGAPNGRVAGRKAVSAGEVDGLGTEQAAQLHWGEPADAAANPNFAYQEIEEQLAVPPVAAEPRAEAELRLLEEQVEYARGASPEDSSVRSDAFGVPTDAPTNAPTAPADEEALFSTSGTVRSRGAQTLQREKSQFLKDRMDISAAQPQLGLSEREQIGLAFGDASSWESLSRRRASELGQRIENAPGQTAATMAQPATDSRFEGAEVKGVDSFFKHERFSELAPQEKQLKAKPRKPSSDPQPSKPQADRESIAPESNAAEDPFSTFSLHVGDVSFKLAAAALAQGQWPDADKVRMEEFVNALDYGDPLPRQSEKVACQIEQCIDPFVQQRNLLRVSLRTAAAGRAPATPLRLTLLLDNSGSMSRIDRQQTVVRAWETLLQQLQPGDLVSLISFARTPRLLADRLSGEQAKELTRLVENLPSEGGTNIEAAVQLAWEKAREQWLEGAQNRIILLTDGAVNLGDANPQRLSGLVQSIRDTGIAFDAAGISANGLNDEVLEALTRKGDGRYYLLDSAESADAGFARQIAGALRPAAMNVKVQVEFNPERVGNYRLLGFDKHRLKQEDFHNDKVDAAEMAAAEAGVALYQFQAKPEGQGDVGSVSVRFRDISTGQMLERRWPIPYQPNAPRADQAPQSMRLATAAALLAAKLGGHPLGATVELKSLAELIAGLPPQHRVANRVNQLEQMIQQARQIGGE